MGSSKLAAVDPTGNRKRETVDAREGIGNRFQLTYEIVAAPCFRESLFPRVIVSASHCFRESLFARVGRWQKYTNPSN